MFKEILKIFSYRRYPMLWVALCTITGILLWSETNHNFRNILYVVSLIALLFDLVLKRAEPLVYSLIILGAYTIAQHSTPTKPPISYNQEAVFVGTLRSNLSEQGSWYKAKLEVFATEDSAGRWYNTPYMLFCGLDSSARGMQVNDTICLKGSLRKIQGGYGDYIFKEGIVGQVYSYQSEVLGVASSSLSSVMQDLRDGARSRIFELDTTKKEAAAIISSMVIGDRSALSEGTTLNYRNSGVSHLLAISGLHIGIVVILLNLLFGVLKFIGRRGRIAYGVVIILALWLYAFFSGMSISVERAAIMFTLYQLALMLHRSTTSFNTLSTAAVVILIFSPYSLYNIGFQLSFMAMIGIFIFYHPLISFVRIRSRVPRALLAAMALSLSAQIGVAPLLVFHFGELAWFGVVLSIMIWFTVPVIIFSSLLYLLTTIDYLGHIALWFTKLQNSIIAMIAQNEWAVVRDIRLTLLELLLCYIAILLLGIWLNIVAQRYSRYKILRIKHLN